ncbi:MAG: hypothetical protein U5L45_19295 [Saprospiraceae bacterium]|nr:hypothetical protein [Saprospiraceae bacterium]
MWITLLKNRPLSDFTEKGCPFGQPFLFSDYLRSGHNLKTSFFD